MITRTRIIMGMPVTLMTPDENASKGLEPIFRLFTKVDQRYSPYIEASVTSKMNRGELDENYIDAEFREILDIAEKTRVQTNGHFDVRHGGTFDPSGIVKGWAIAKAADLFAKYTSDYYVEAGGDIQVSGINEEREPWRIGVRNPFNRNENVAVVSLKNQAIATSGTAIRGKHIYDPTSKESVSGITSLSIIGKSILDADRFATAAFAMGKSGIEFIEHLPGYEGLMIMDDKRVVKTTGWYKYETQPA